MEDESENQAPGESLNVQSPNVADRPPDALVDDPYVEVSRMIRSRLERHLNRMTYVEAAEILLKIGFNLDETKRAQAREEIRWWGLREGEDAKQREAQLETCQIFTRELQKVIELMKAGVRLQVIFSFDNTSRSLMTNARERFKNQFIGTHIDLGVPDEDWEYGVQLLPAYGPITGALVDDPTIIFTRADREVPNETQGHSPNDWYNLFGKPWDEYERETGRAWARCHDEFLRPSEWLYLFLRSIDNGLRTLYPDRNIEEMNWAEYHRLRRDTLRQDRRIDQYLLDLETTTLFPNWRDISDIEDGYEAGMALGLKSKSGGKGIAVVECKGVEGRSSYGPRLAFGR